MKTLLKALAALLLFPTIAFADCQMVEFSNTSNILRLKILDSTTNNGKTGLTSASSGLIIGTIADNEATTTTYTVAGSTIESITTLGTYAAPTATKVRFKEVDATNHKGIYEIQLANARFAVANSTNLIVSVSGVSGTLDSDCSIALVHPVSDFWAYAPAAELASVPGATPTMVQAIQWVYELMKHKLTQTSSTATIYKNDSSTSLGTSTTSDDGTTFSRGKYN